MSGVYKSESWEELPRNIPIQPIIYKKKLGLFYICIKNSILTRLVPKSGPIKFYAILELLVNARQRSYTLFKVLRTARMSLGIRANVANGWMKVKVAGEVK